MRRNFTAIDSMLADEFIPFLLRTANENGIVIRIYINNDPPRHVIPDAMKTDNMESPPDRIVDIEARCIKPGPFVFRIRTRKGCAWIRICDQYYRSLLH